jgi:hypothetical protein
MNNSTEPPVETPQTTSNGAIASFNPHRHSLPAKQHIVSSKSQAFSGRSKTHNRRISDYSIHTQPPAAFSNQRSTLSPQQIRQSRLRILPTQFEGSPTHDPSLPDTSHKGFRKIKDHDTASAATHIPKRSTSLHHITVFIHILVHWGDELI